MATIVSLKYFTDTKFAKAEKLPAMTLASSGVLDVLSKLSHTINFSYLFKYKHINNVPIIDL